ncbi:MAG TPA: hypothetical protein VJU82_00230, partial [Acidobacteriaceae bacterium]|nr:hypothetical protein [Acidobacteriaceae bacterium]
SRSVASEVAEAAAAYGCSDWVLITAGTGEAHPNILTFDRLASLLESEPVIARDSTGAAVLDAQLYDRLSQVGHEIDAHDPSGIKWLPALARNQLPPALARLRTPASALFERYGLRVFTTCLLLGGRRLGASRPGQAEPDALIWDSRGRLALIDFKAAREGWGMERDDLRALMEYGARRYDVPNGHPRVPDAVVVVSSRFKAADAARARRAAEFEARGQRLVHLSADDLVSVALHARDLGDRDTSSLTSADWEPVTRHHTPTVDVLLSVLREQ